MDKKETTNTIYQPNYKADAIYQKPEKQTFDTTDWPHSNRKFRIYDEFTKTFDKTTNIEK